MRHRSLLSPAALLAALILFVVLCPLPAVAAGTAGTPEDPHIIPEVDGRVTPDGILDEPLWDEAFRFELAYETNPGENVTPPLVRTEVLLVSSATHLYAAFIAHDPDPSQICASICDRDRMYNDDRVSLMLDTFNDHRRAYMFFTNPLGVQGDALDPNGQGSGNASWDAIWDSGGRITETGYAVEFVIPFTSLRFQRVDGPQTWGIGAGRKYSRTYDYRFSPLPRDRDDDCYLCQVMKVRGFEGATPGRNIEIDPTVSGFVSEERDPFPGGDFEQRGDQLDVGVTARWGITPNLVLSTAVNPDFSQVEADAFELEANTQFAIYYDEKRPFFLEGTEFFQTRLNALYTRTIADPLWGLKLTGKEGGNAIGAFVTQDEITNLLFPGPDGSDGTSLDMRSTSAVLRYRRDLGESSTVGLFVSDRECENYYNRVGGIDANLKFLTSERLGIQILTTQTSYPTAVADTFGLGGTDFEGTAYDIEYNHSASEYEWWLAYRQIDEGYRTDLGWRPKVGFRQSRCGLTRVIRGETGDWYGSWNFGGGYVHEEKLDGELLESFFDCWGHYNGPLRSHVGYYGMFGTKSYDDEEYDTRFHSVDTSMWPSGWLELEMDTEFGQGIDYANGQAADVLVLSPSVSVQAGRRLSLAYGHEYERLDVEGGTLYTANVDGLWATYQFTKRVFLRAVLQYADYEFDTDLYSDGRGPEYQELASQVLFSYKINPQTVLYLGYSDNHMGDVDIDLTQSDRTFFAKIGYALVL